jgi:NAD(P)-dependent dehydrogenase (short-subunit alcohol dehydrogenase family)
MAKARPTGKVTYHNRGRVVLVTGGCGGIGRAICEAFARSGASGVVALDLHKPSGKLPLGVEFHACDVTQDEQCAESVAWTVGEFGGLDVLVNTAAIQPPESYLPLHLLPVEQWERMIAVNLTGYANMARHAVRVMLRQESGVIINLASGQGHRTTRGVPVYGPAKAGNLLQAMQWGIEYARQGIRVVSVSPGAIDTPLVRATLEQQGGAAELANRHPLGRIGKPEEVAAGVLWLASGDASFVTATDLAVDGGLNALGAFAEPYPRDGAVAAE